MDHARRPQGPWAGKPFRDSLRLAVLRDLDDDAKGKTKLDRIATVLIQKAIDGDVPAAKEVVDRLEGKVPQAVIGGDETDNPVRIVTEIRRTIVDAETK